MPNDTKAPEPKQFDYYKAAAKWCDKWMYSKAAWYDFPVAPDEWTIGGRVSCDVIAVRLAHKYMQTAFGSDQRGP